VSTTEPVAVETEHDVNPGQRAFVRVSLRHDGSGHLGAWRCDDDGGAAIECGVFVDPPEWLPLTRLRHAWVALRSEPSVLKPRP
jgi:hypothetical protein